DPFSNYVSEEHPRKTTTSIDKNISQRHNFHIYIVTFIILELRMHPLVKIIKPDEQNALLRIFVSPATSTFIKLAVQVQELVQF
ncbi:hypothetical protein ACJX0J_038699, partial [Zea mays]